MMLRVTRTATWSSAPPVSDPVIPPSAAAPSSAAPHDEHQSQPKKEEARPLPPELERKPKEECFRRRPRPVSGRGPARVSSQSLSRRPIILRRNHGTAPEESSLITCQPGTGRGAVRMFSGELEGKGEEERSGGQWSDELACSVT
ncbi:hypothetical protein GW17_00027681 [Ensete ventricosum]|nr:hypothetical protein GW17_00027681 [Ensete ventricosum]